MNLIDYANISIARATENYRPLAQHGAVGPETLTNVIAVYMEDAQR